MSGAGSVRVVTDSACDLPLAATQAWAVEVVPLTIRFGSETLTDREDVDAAGFWRRLRDAATLPETAAPSVGAFARRFDDLAEQDAAGILCVCLSGELSATIQSARLAAHEARVPVEVVDSRTCSMGLGMLAIGAARLAADGATLAEVVADVLERRDRTRLYGTLDTLEFLKRGGRIGNAAALLGSVLSIKPVVEVREGLVQEAGKVRTRSRALALLAERVRAQPVESLAVLDGEARDVDVLLELLAPDFPVDQIVRGTVGPVIGTHAGPGVIGVTFQVR